MTIGEMFNALVARVVAAPPPGVDAAYIERFIRRNHYVLTLRFAEAQPPVPVVVAILRGDWRWPVPESEVPALRVIAERIDAEMGRSLEGFDAIPRELESRLHLYIMETLEAELPPRFGLWARFDLALRIWTFYRQRVLARALP